ncbi:valine--tRNA ligase [Bacteroidota bacterium]
MNIPAKYDPSQTEEKWYDYWLENGFFSSKPDNREAYTIVIPPPNVTGVLHMGHMLNNTIQDVMVRRARMTGKNACWVPGTDHASIATEARVVAKLEKEGINKNEISREEFLNHAWEWKERHGGMILEQLKKLGASCDWERTKFTMDAGMSESVIDVFIDLYNKGYIYRGIRMVNWDPQAQTAVSDEEVVHKEVKSKLFYIRYQIEESDEYLTIATTRPETILGDTAVCVNPSDERYSHLKGKKLIIPLINRVVPLIQDDYVDKEFGTGALKITPAHDIHDYEIGHKHKIPSIDILNDDGSLNENAKIFIGKDRFEARDLIVEELEKHGFLVKIEDYINKIGYSERTDVAIEPKLSMQWFCDMKKMAEPALENVMNGNIKIYPQKFINTYKHWMENLNDWCVSRQLWWGQRIPAYYLPDGDFVVAKTDEEAVEMAREKTANTSIVFKDLKQDEDVLDTWFSSWLWPISVFDGIRKPDNEDIRYYYPTNDLITAPDILFFWVARMIMAGYEYRGKEPFRNIYLTGIVRDMKRRKMSKSLGNSPEPLELIKKYGADGVRVGMLLCSPAGGDLLFDESLTEQGRNFANKIWNAFRLVKGWESDKNIKQPESSKLAVEWFDSMLNKGIEQLNDHYLKYRISDALMTVYKLFWDEFSSWYLEIVKPDYQKPIDETTLKATICFFDKLVKIIHPFMPFITEEIWQLIEKRNEGNSIMVSNMPEQGSYNKKFLQDFEDLKEIITHLRKIRKDKNLGIKDALSLKVRTAKDKYFSDFDSLISRLAHVSDIEIVSNEIKDAVPFIVKSTEFFVPISENIDVEGELIRLTTELEYSEGFLKTVSKKLSNESFVNNAPEKVVEMEKKKQSDTIARIMVLKEQIESMKNQ